MTELDLLHRRLLLRMVNWERAEPLDSLFFLEPSNDACVREFLARNIHAVEWHTRGVMPFGPLKEHEF